MAARLKTSRFLFSDGMYKVTRKPKQSDCSQKSIRPIFYIVPYTKVLPTTYQYRYNIGFVYEIIDRLVFHFSIWEW